MLVAFPVGDPCLLVGETHLLIGAELSRKSRGAPWVGKHTCRLCSATWRSESCIKGCNRSGTLRAAAASCGQAGLDKSERGPFEWQNTRVLMKGITEKTHVMHPAVSKCTHGWFHGLYTSAIS